MLPLLAIAAGIALTWVLDIRRTRAAEAAYPPVGQFVDVAGGRVHYVQTGQGPDLVLLHGAGGNLRDYTFDLVPLLAERYRVTVFDRPGMGYTDRAPGVPTGALATDAESPAQQAAMLRAAAEELGITGPVVAGHSFGGIVAMAWALEGLEQDSPANASAIVSFAGVLMPWPGTLGAYYTVNGSAFGGAVVTPLISAFVPKSVIDETIDATFQPQSAPAGYIDHFGGPLSVRLDSFRANVRQVNTLRPHVVEMVKRYPELTLPIEILHGTADDTVPITVHPMELVKIVPSATLTPLEGIGHMIHHVDPAAAIATIDRAATRAGLR